MALPVEATEGQVPEGEGACPARQQVGSEWEPAAACEVKADGSGLGPWTGKQTRAGDAGLSGAMASDAFGLEMSAKDPVQEEGLQKRPRGPPVPPLRCV